MTVSPTEMLKLGLFSRAPLWKQSWAPVAFRASNAVLPSIDHASWTANALSKVMGLSFPVMRMGSLLLPRVSHASDSRQGFSGDPTSMSRGWNDGCSNMTQSRRISRMCTSETPMRLHTLVHVLRLLALSLVSLMRVL